MSTVSIDFSKTLGPMKPMHGLNHGPLTGNLKYDARHLFLEAGIPYTRLHDVEYPYGSGEYVDIPCIFKNFDADVEDPASYNFDLTDDYMKAIAETGCKPLYRLGVSIEHPEKKRHIYPPKDFLKWAKICEHIIRHYNEGWADGFYMDIEYWEIWTEPNHCKKENPLMWGGDMPEFARFYDVSATYLKECFPNLKIGGPAFSSPAGASVHVFFETLAEMKKHPPMDFYSWHGYVNTVEQARKRARDAEEILRQYGYSEAESIYDEWNFVTNWDDMQGFSKIIHSYKGMAFNAAMMAAMQSEHVDMMNFYAVTQQFLAVWNSLFEQDPTVNNRNGGLRMMRKCKPFEPFIAFGNLYRLKTQTALSSDDERLYGVAAGDGEKSGFMLASFAPLDEELTEKEVHFSVKGLAGRKVTLYVTDETRDAKKIVTFSSEEFDFIVPPYSMIFAAVE